MTTPKKICSCSTCAHAGKPQALRGFGRNNTSPDGLHWYCKVCNNQKQREWKLANPDKVRAWKQAYVDRQKMKHSKKARSTPRQMELDL